LLRAGNRAESPVIVISADNLPRYPPHPTFPLGANPITPEQIAEIERLLERKLTPQEKTWLEYAEKLLGNNVYPFPDRRRKEPAAHPEKKSAKA